MVSDLEYMEVKRGMSVGTLFIGIAIGAVAGGLAALLLTPRSGKETRDLFRTKAMDAQHMVQDRVQQVKERVGKVRENMKSKADEEVQNVDMAYRRSSE